MPVPDDLYRRSGDYLLRIAAGPESPAPFDLAEARTRAYAIYLLTRRGRITTNYLNALQESLEAGAAEEWRGDVASAYMAASHAALRNDALAEGLIGGYRLGARTRPDTDFDTGLGRDALYVYLLARHFPERMASLDGGVVRRLVQPVFEDRFNTLSAAYTILALGAIHRRLEARGELSPPVVSARPGGGCRRGRRGARGIREGVGSGDGPGTEHLVRGARRRLLHRERVGLRCRGAHGAARRGH